MKALERAAQDRNKASDSPPAAAASVPPTDSHSLSLAPMEPTLQADTPPPPAAPAPRAAKPGAASAATSAPKRAAEQLRASALLSSSARPTTGAGGGAGQFGAWVSAHPVPFAAALAGVFAVGYGTYLYLQIKHPSLFMRQAAPQPVLASRAGPPPPPTAVPVNGAPAAPTDAASPLISAQSVFGSKPDVPASASASLPPAAELPQPALGANAAPPKPVAPVNPVGTAPAAVLVAPQARVAVSRADNTAPRVNPSVSEGYAALGAGHYDAALRLYEQALRAEPNNIDALLGLAAIAQHENRAEDAARHYLKILDLDPRHALAQTGLIALLGRADPQAAETRLKQLAARDPSPTLYFTLGNLYADQGQWSQAQQAYFQAFHLDAGNPDYAYNLAVALEHLGQPKIALGFYRQAMQLATGRGRSNFNPARTQARISQLAARLE